MVVMTVYESRWTYMKVYDAYEGLWVYMNTYDWYMKVYDGIWM